MEIRGDRVVGMNPLISTRFISCIGSVSGVLLLGACASDAARSCPVAAVAPAGERMAEGVLLHHPSDVRSVQAWLGHRFEVGGVPVQATEVVDEAALLARVGRQVRVSGPWNPGRVWNPGDEEMLEQYPVDARPGVTVRGAGIRVMQMEPLATGSR